MIRQAVVVIVLAAALAACSASSSTMATSQTSQMTHSSASDASPLPAVSLAESAPSCNLKSSGRDLIVWERDDDENPYASVLGDIALSCQPTIDWIGSTLPDGGTTYCVQIAYADQNPGYNADADTPAKPKHVVKQYGTRC